MRVHLSEKVFYSLQQIQCKVKKISQWQKLETVKHKLLSNGRQHQEHLKYKKTYSTKLDDRKNQLYPASAISKGDNQDRIS